jgi:putative transposase
MLRRCARARPQVYVPPPCRGQRYQRCELHHASKGTYGTRRVTAELRLGYEVTANRKAVRRIMLRLGLQGLPVLTAKRRGPATDGVAAGDLVLRQFARDAPNRLWLTDLGLVAT